MRQLADEGIRARYVNAQIQHGTWQRLSSTVLALHAQPITRVARLWAASLHYERCGLAGPSVLELLNLPEPHGSEIHVIGPRAGRPSPMSLCVQHTSVACRLEATEPLRVTEDLAVIQALAWAKSDRQAIFFATWAIQRGIVTLEQLQAVRDPLLRAREGKRARARLALIQPGIHSVNEFDFAHECAKRGLPEPVRQRQRLDSAGRKRFTDVEFHTRAGRLIVEIDGIGHLDTTVRVDDQFRANELTLQGDPVLRIPAIALRSDPEPFFQQIRRALRGAHP